MSKGRMVKLSGPSLPAGDANPMRPRKALVVAHDARKILAASLATVLQTRIESSIGSNQACGSARRKAFFYRRLLMVQSEYYN